MKNFTLSIAFFISSWFTCQANGYQCYNYTGTVGKASINLSYQITPDYFGEAAKKNFNVNGVYSYTQYNTPIRLEGILDANQQTITLYEMNKEQRTATFILSLQDQKISGTWAKVGTTTSLPVQLQLTTSLNDTQLDTPTVVTEIPQFDSLPDYYFVGVYTKKAGATQAEMTALKIMRKKDHHLFQEISFTDATVPTGNLMTVIYDQIEVTSPKAKNFTVANQYGRTGGYWNIVWNTQTQRFEKAVEPIGD